MLKAIQKEVENLRIKVYSGLSTEDTDTALYEIEQMLFKAMDKQLTLTDVVSTCCDKVPSDSYYLGTTCLKCNKPFRQINK